MDNRARGAADLLTALHRAGAAFRTYGSGQGHTHPSVTWEYASKVGHATEPFATVGVTFKLRDEQDRWVSLSVDLWARDGGFDVEATALVDDPKPTRLGGGDQRFLREFPEVRTSDLDEAVAAVERMTEELCAYDSVLDELGVPRIER